MRSRVCDRINCYVWCVKRKCRTASMNMDSQWTIDCPYSHWLFRISVLHFRPLAVNAHTGCSAFPFYTSDHWLSMFTMVDPHFRFTLKVHWLPMFTLAVPHIRLTLQQSSSYDHIPGNYGADKRLVLHVLHTSESLSITTPDCDEFNQASG